ncbi:14241_t:CDS:2 [Rhizophagus irregularis]|nr:14241_t:CDS:2 [Rhizophagus irregularis]
MSNRGFVNVIDNKGENDEHPFINSRKDDLNKVMNIKSPRTVTEYLWIPNNTKEKILIQKIQKLTLLQESLQRNFQYDYQILENIPQQSENQDQEPSTKFKGKEMVLY